MFKNATNSLNNEIQNRDKNMRRKVNIIINEFHEDKK